MGECWPKMVHFSLHYIPPRSPARCDALGRRAREAVPDSQSASECRERAQARKSGTNKAGVIWWSSDAEKRKRRRKSRKARAALERNEALVLSAKNRQIFQDIPRRELSAEAQHNSLEPPTARSSPPSIPQKNPATKVSALPPSCRHMKGNESQNLLLASKYWV